jgi:hypothetical protein
MYSTIPEKYFQVIEKFKVRGISNNKFLMITKDLWTGEEHFFHTNDKSSCWLDEKSKLVRFVKIPESVSCVFGDGRSITISKKEHPEICDALLLFAKSPYIISKRDKYLMAYHAYELVTKNKRIEFRSIRHALTHPTKMLSDRETIETLNRLFGTVDMDLSKRKHTKVFYEYYFELLKEIDNLLYMKLNDFAQ